MGTHPKRIYKGPTYYTKPQNTTQSSGKQYKAPKTLYKDIKTTQFLRKHRKVNKSMKSTFHKCVLNVNAGPNPTPMSKLGKQNEKTH